jgi:hypothetical protein
MLSSEDCALSNSVCDQQDRYNLIPNAFRKRFAAEFRVEIADARNCA